MTVQPCMEWIPIKKKTKQTSDALKRTLLFHAALIEDLLTDAYEFVLLASKAFHLNEGMGNIVKWVEDSSSCLFKMSGTQRRP